MVAVLRFFIVSLPSGKVSPAVMNLPPAPPRRNQLVNNDVLCRTARWKETAVLCVSVTTTTKINVIRLHFDYPSD